MLVIKAGRYCMSFWKTLNSNTGNFQKVFSAIPVDIILEATSITYFKTN